MKSAFARVVSRRIAPLALATTIITSTGTGWAGTDVGNGYGMVGITLGQTIRLNVVNLGGPDTLPCDTTLTFFDSEGNVLTRFTESMDPGQAAFLDLHGEDLVLRVRERMQIRATMEATCRSEGDPRDLPTTLEVFDDKTGQTSIILNPVVLKGFNPQPEPPGSRLNLLGR